MTHWINLHILDYVYIDKCILPAITLTKTTIMLNNYYIINLN